MVNGLFDKVCVMSKWISVKDKLPNFGENVLAYSLLGKPRYIRECLYTNQFHSLHKHFDESVTHWQPLPEVPNAII